ncbi:MAG: HEAT repeat domain-containing protein [Longimicrobiales bacterium]|nr:HEAT repeat domain-containing protein [Longimicrobiales bacterium]
MGETWEEHVFPWLGVLSALLLAVALLFTLLTLVLRWRHHRADRVWRELEARWERQLLEVLAGAGDAAALLGRVRPGEALRFLAYLSRYARRVTGEETRILRALARPHLPRLEAVYRRGAAEERARAVQTLGLLGMPDYAPLLRRALDDPSPLVSIIAARALSGLHEPGDVSRVIERLHRYALWHPAFLAGLLTDAGKGGEAVLRDALADDGRPSGERAVVAQALRNLRDPRAADAAAAVLARAGDTDLTVACLRLLAEVGEGRHRPAVLPLLDDPRFQVRAAAVAALGVVGGERDVSDARAALDDPSSWVGLEAARALRALDGDTVLPEIAREPGRRGVLARQVLAE